MVRTLAMARLRSRSRPPPLAPPIRAIPTGPVRRPRFRRSRSRRSGPVLRSTTPTSKWKDDSKVSALVSKLAARKTPLDEAEKSVKEFLGRLRGRQDRQRKTAVRRPVRHAQRPALPGHERARTRQPQAARGRRQDPRGDIQLQALQDATPRDDTKVDALSNQLIWETRIFEDRHKVVRFVCEVPTTIDQRLFALGRVIQQEME